jgi:hypothetical protein
VIKRKSLIPAVKDSHLNSVARSLVNMSRLLHIFVQGRTVAYWNAAWFVNGDEMA